MEERNAGLDDGNDAQDVQEWQRPVDQGSAEKILRIWPRLKNLQHATAGCSENSEADDHRRRNVEFGKRPAKYSI